LKVVGQALRKVDATAKVTGTTKFADDLSLPRMLYAKLLRSPHPHARIVAIDATGALALPGVKAVLTGRDLPIPFGILPVSQDEHALALDKTRFVRDPPLLPRRPRCRGAPRAPDPRLRRCRESPQAHRPRVR
jgi:4-hydroxybenzoyl-CoA reductase subunit alpha